MSKTIKLEDAVYTELESILWRRETFSHGVKRLLEIRRSLLGFSDVIEGAKTYDEAKSSKVHAASSSD